MRRACLVAVAVLLAAPSVLAQRLPKNVVPTNYALRFVTDLAAEKFSGEETISVTIKEPTNRIVLNVDEIEIDDVTITSAGKRYKPAISVDHMLETATFTVDEPLARGPASIFIRFRGILNDKLRGFYISKTARRKYAVTQMEPTDARRAFPSFDEPAFKATFDITLVVDEGDTAISNAKLIRDEPGPTPGKHTLTFARTAKMSTYLVAMLVGDWQCSEGSSDGIPIRVCAVPEKKELTKWGLTTAEAELKYFNEYYAFRYPFGKLDIIAFPDFEAGAMENVGAITFREAALLVDEKTGSALHKRYVAQINSHEIAHMWFGDVVTMEWWDDIWLNEGFATWITSKPIEAWKPEWDLAVEEASSTSNSLTVDSTESTRPIRQKADTPAEINQMFDGIAYGKTAAVLRMLEAYVGEESFRDGIRAYVKKYAWGNAKAEDFWSTMTAVTKQPIDKMMPSFVMQAGAPLVRASARCEGAATLLTLAQQRMYSRRAPFLADPQQLWTVPVTVRNLDAPSEAPRKFLLKKKEETFRIAGCSAHLFVNYDGRGFYRTAHAAGMIPAVGDLTKILSPSERVVLVNDVWALVKIGEESIATQLTLFDRLREDRERAVVDAILTKLAAIRQDLLTEEQAPVFRRWVAAYLRPMIAELGWTPVAGEPDERKRLRSSVVRVLGHVARDEETLAKARELTELSLREPGSVDATLLDVVVSLAAINGDAALMQKLKSAMAESKSPGEYYRYRFAMLAFEEPALVQEAYRVAISPEMRNQDLPGYIESMFGYSERHEEAWAFFKNNWDALRKNFTPWGGASIVGATGAFCDPKLREDVQQFFAAHPVEASDRALKKALEEIDMCIELRTLQSQNFAAWLAGVK
ncbi:MAG TPA: M1 family metallopeptidase [Thermoanaerobaculia bacterium]|nr:M1 family metallopeptidase [Thermoanaerobaculia bacterium]